MHWINQRKQLPAAYFGLCTLIKWDFALDHYNYSRWLTVYHFDLVNLEQQHPDVYENSCKGYFSFSKSCSEFSTMALEQLHEQNNEIIKGVGMATRLLHREEESALLHWELCGSEIVNMIRSFEESINPTPSTEEFGYKNHHEDTAAFRQRFVGDVKRLLKNFLVNPFDTDEFTAVKNNAIDFDEEIVKSIKSISDLGKRQFKDFWSKRLVKAEVPITETISKNNLRLPRHMIDDKSGDAKDPILTRKIIS